MFRYWYSRFHTIGRLCGVEVVIIFDCNVLGIRIFEWKLNESFNLVNKKMAISLCPGMNFRCWFKVKKRSHLDILCFNLNNLHAYVSSALWLPICIFCIYIKINPQHIAKFDDFQIWNFIHDTKEYTYMSKIQSRVKKNNNFKWRE